MTFLGLIITSVLRLFEADYRYTHIDFGPGDPLAYHQGGRANLSLAPS